MAKYLSKSDFQLASSCPKKGELTTVILLIKVRRRNEMLKVDYNKLLIHLQ